MPGSHDEMAPPEPLKTEPLKDRSTMDKKKELRRGNTSPMLRRSTPDHLNYRQKFRSDPWHLSFHGGSDCKSGTPSILPLTPSKAISTLLILWRPSYSNPCNSHLQTGLLQLTLHRPSLDPDSETTTCTERSCSSFNQYPMEITHTTDSSTITLATSRIPAPSCKDGAG